MTKKAKALFITAAIVTLLVVAAILATAVQGTPAENAGGLQSFGLVILWMTFVVFPAALIALGYFIRGLIKSSDNENSDPAATELAAHGHFKNSRPFSRVTHNCSTTVLQVGAGRTDFCGGKTVVNEESREEE